MPQKFIAGVPLKNYQKYVKEYYIKQSQKKTINREKSPEKSLEKNNRKLGNFDTNVILGGRKSRRKGKGVRRGTRRVVRC